MNLSVKMWLVAVICIALAVVGEKQGFKMLPIFAYIATAFSAMIAIGATVREDKD